MRPCSQRRGKRRNVQMAFNDIISKLSRAWEGLGLPVPFDKVLHFAVCLVLTLVLSLITPYAPLIVLVIGLGKECYDMIDYGHFCGWDIVADLVGITLACVLI